MKIQITDIYAHIAAYKISEYESTLNLKDLIYSLNCNVEIFRCEVYRVSQNSNIISYLFLPTMKK